MVEGHKGYFTTCPIHEHTSYGGGEPYSINWRNKGLEEIGHYFSCCGVVCLKSTRAQYNSIVDWKCGERMRQPYITSVWVKEALEGDTDIWRDRGELDASYGFGVINESIPDYQVHEAITYLHTLDENIGETVLNQYFLAEPHALAWELDELMSSPEMRDDIRKHFNVNLFQLIQERADKESHMQKAVRWLEGNALLTPDPLRATQALYRLKAQTDSLPQKITMADIQSIIEHTNKAGFVVEESDVSKWFDELKSYGVELDKSNIHPDYQP